MEACLRLPTCSLSEGSMRRMSHQFAGIPANMPDGGNVKGKLAYACLPVLIPREVCDECRISSRGLPRTCPTRGMKENVKWKLAYACLPVLFPREVCDECRISSRGFPRTCPTEGMSRGSLLTLACLFSFRGKYATNVASVRGDSREHARRGA